MISPTDDFQKKSEAESNKLGPEALRVSSRKLAFDTGSAFEPEPSTFFRSPGQAQYSAHTKRTAKEGQIETNAEQRRIHNDAQASPESTREAMRRYYVYSFSGACYNSHWKR